MGIRPTHLDSHMGALFTKPALMAVLVNVAHEYHLPFLMLKIPGTPPEMYSALKPTDVILDHVFMAAPPIKPDDWLSYYTHILKTCRPEFRSSSFTSPTMTPKCRPSPWTIRTMAAPGGSAIST